ncbi:MAG: PEP-CTERM sorting domain-containing protein [Woronichinia naegeliana WA131]|uniref:PEP-CTERM sorting domain-containing protein n=1 Tax=Woronichinia naegeliana WA131 TaxID=2824559 RepID=A0A977KRW2_9CYAN|nr:MAG: PEP-CTERM sorting domain-containing protein [Woronichinia naegeliana WA131]
MINFKTVSLGLAVSSLGFFALATDAQAYSFDFLGASPSSGANAGSIDWKFGFNSQGFDQSLGNDNRIVFGGFSGLKSAGFGPTMSSSTNDTIVVPTSIVFQEIINVDLSIGEVTYTALSNLSQINGNVKYQTFVVTADAVPTGYVLGDYQLPNGSSLLPNGAVQIPVPEPFTILGSLAALGFGAFGQKEYAKKQSQNSDSDLT